MIELIAAALAWLASPEDVERLRRTAPTYLTAETARDHLGAARAAALVARVEPAVLLSIAHHESRYSIGERTAEEGHKVSCGSMTPEPKRRCSRSDLTLVGGYLAGAMHLRRWMMACGQPREHGSRPGRCALLGYAGGFRLIEICRRSDRRACGTPDVFRSRERWIAGRSAS